MTREMNKPDWHLKYYSILHCAPLKSKCSACDSRLCKYRIKPEPVLDDWIKPFVDSVNERFKQC